MIKLLKVLADETRMRLLRLCEDEELNVNELSAILDMAQPRISNHLKLLRDSGLLIGRREGTWAYYRMPSAKDLDATAARMWREARQWMDASGLHAPDLARREEALRARNETAQRYFESIGAEWDRIGQSLVDRAMRDQLLMTLIPRSLTAAEVGIGSGRFLASLAERVEAVIGIEPSAPMIEAARRRLEESGFGRVELRHGSLEDLPLEAGSVDAVFCNLTLHHSPRPAAAVERMAEALRPGGSLTICDFAAHSVDWMREEMADYWLGFEPEKLTEWMNDAGLAETRILPLGGTLVDRGNGGRHKARLEIMAATAIKPEKRGQEPF